MTRVSSARCGLVVTLALVLIALTLSAQCQLSEITKSSPTVTINKDNKEVSLTLPNTIADSMIWFRHEMVVIGVPEGETVTANVHLEFTPKGSTKKAIIESVLYEFVVDGSKQATGSYSTCSEIVTEAGTDSVTNVGDKLGDWTALITLMGNTIPQGFALNASLNLGATGGLMNVNGDENANTIEVPTMYYAFTLDGPNRFYNVQFKLTSNANNQSLDWVDAIVLRMNKCPIIDINNDPDPVVEQIVIPLIGWDWSTSDLSFNAIPSGEWFMAIQTSEFPNELSIILDATETTPPPAEPLPTEQQQSYATFNSQSLQQIVKLDVTLNDSTIYYRSQIATSTIPTPLSIEYVFSFASKNGTEVVILSTRNVTLTMGDVVEEIYSPCSTVNTPYGSESSVNVGNKIGTWQLAITILTPMNDGDSIDLDSLIGADTALLPNASVHYPVIAETPVSYFDVDTHGSSSSSWTVSVVLTSLVPTEPLSWLKSITYSQTECPQFDSLNQPVNSSAQSTVIFDADETRNSSVTLTLKNLKAGRWHFAVLGEESNTLDEFLIMYTATEQKSSDDSWSTTTIIIVSAVAGGIALLLVGLTAAAVIYLRRRQAYDTI